LTKAQKKRNRKKSTIRVRVEHIFWFMTNTMKDGLNMRWIGMPRITAGIGLLNLVYNLARYEQILRVKLAEWARGMKRPRKEETMKRKRRKQVGIRENQGVRKQNTAGKNPRC
jgi:Transposase DDE domain